MKKLLSPYNPILLMVWCCLLFANTKSFAQQCETYFKYTFQNNFCPANSQCLIADNVNYTFSAQSGADYYFWNFGDGTSQKDSTGKISHAYFKPGNYSVSVVAYFLKNVSNPCKAYKIETLEVKFPNDTVLPNPCAADLQTATNSLSLKAWDSKPSITTDAMTQTLYFWNFGDGSYSVTHSYDNGTNHDYKKSGKYLLRMTKLIRKAYKNSEVCTGTITVDSITIKTSCYQNEICRETIIKWVEIENPLMEISNCNIKANVAAKGNSIHYSTYSTFYWQKTDSTVNNIDIQGPALKPFKTYQYWSFGDGSDTISASGVHTYKKPGKYLVILHSAEFHIAPTLVACQALIYDSIIHTGISCNEMPTCRSVDSAWLEVGPDIYPSCYAKANVEVKNQTITYEIPQPIICFVDSNWVAPADPQTINYWSFGDGKDTVALSGTHTYAKPGKYLVVLHSAKYSGTNPEIGCASFRLDSFVNILIPCYYKLECRSVDSVWVEIKDNNDWKCLETTVKGMDIKTHMGIYYTMEYKPGEFRHRYYNFGDGTDTMGVQEATHTYAKPGKYLVTGTEVTYYSPILAHNEGHPESPIADCMAMYEDKSVRFINGECSLREVGRVVCTEWVTVNMPLGVNIFPNPANAFGNVSIENAEGNVDFMVYNATGMLVQKMENITNGTQQFVTENLANGLYIYTILKDGKILKRDKFAVNR